MILSSAVRLICLCLASFFVVHLATGLGVFLLSAWAIRIAEHLRPRLAANFLIGLRLLPLVLSTLVVAGLCVPSYLWLEPEGADEEVGVLCLVAALLGLTIAGISLSRGLRAVIRTRRLIDSWHHAAGRLPMPAISLAGAVRPELFISRQLVSALSTEELDVALSHEGAHRRAYDNLKRLFILLSPDVLPGCHIFGPLDRGWKRVTEWAADDDAAAGDPRRAVALASALVRVARIASAPPTPLVTSLLDYPEGLAERVNRLIQPSLPVPDAGSRKAIASAVLVAGGLTILVLQPASLELVHRLMEQFTH